MKPHSGRPSDFPTAVGCEGGPRRRKTSLAKAPSPSCFTKLSRLCSGRRPGIKFAITSLTIADYDTKEKAQAPVKQIVAGRLPDLLGQAKLAHR